VLSPFGRAVACRARRLFFFLGCVVFLCASRSPGVSLSLSVGKTTVDESIMCVAYVCVGVLGGVYLCWVVVELLTCVWCGVLVVWGMIAGCSTSDVGRDACSFLVYYSLSSGLCPRVESLSFHSH
jgi:hypothetical protein